MAIDLQSLSITSAFNSIVSYFRSQENNSAFRDLTNGSEGSFLIRLLANVMSVISYRIVAQSRENYLSTAALPASNIGISVNLGYSVPRGSNLKRLVRLVPNGNYTIPRFSVLGSYNTEYSIICVEDKDVYLKEGVPVNIETVVGNLREESFTVGTSDIKIFTLFNSNISDDFILYKDGVEVPTTTVIKEMLEDKYLVRTNPYSSVDIAYLNTLESAKYKYGNGTEMTLRYIELADVPVIPYSSSMFTYGTLDDYRTVQGSRGMETVESMKVTAPLYHETQNLIRSKADYASALRINVPSVTEVNFKALTPTYTQITYLQDKFNLLTGTYQPVGSSKENEELLEATQIQTFMDLLRRQNYFGTPLPDITPPQKEEASLSISIALKNKYKNIADINLDVQNILDNYYDTYLNVTFNTYELERKIEELSYVKYARVGYKIYERDPDTYYQLGYLIYDENTNNYYKAAKMLGKVSGNTNNNVDSNYNVDLLSSITVGTDIDTNAVFLDGSVYWKCYKKLPEYLKVSERIPNGSYGIGDFMYINTPELKDLMFKCVDVVRNSGMTKPDTTTAEVGDFLTDNGIVWVVINRISDPTIPEWSASTNYRIGQRVNGVGDDFSLECIGYAGRVSAISEPNFVQGTYEINSYNVDSKKFTIDGKHVSEFHTGDKIRVYYNIPGSGDTDSEFTITKVTIDTDENGNFRTYITVEEDLNESYIYNALASTAISTDDGQISWEIVDSIDKMTYGWNSYVTFKYELEILGD